MTDPRVDRRSFLRATLLGASSVAAGALLAACSTAGRRWICLGLLTARAPVIRHLAQPKD